MAIINKQAIGIFDSGVGGLSVLSSIQKQLPNENLIYLADTLYAPYGDRTDDFIDNRVQKIAHFLTQQSIKLLVVACNTATATSINRLRSQYSIPIIGLEPALKPAVEASKNNKIGVIATHATLKSQKYQVLRSRFADKAEIIEKATPQFVNIVESLSSLTSKDINIIERELEPFLSNNVDSLVLGCTHFPFIADIIQKIVGPQVKLYESGEPVANEVKRRLEGNFNTQNALGTKNYYSSSPKLATPIFEHLLNQKVKLKTF